MAVVQVENPAQDMQKAREQQTADLNQLINGIQQASAAGMTTLPARDIPQQQNHITQDNTTRANYIPTGPDDYIQAHQTQEEIIRRNGPVDWWGRYDTGCFLREVQVC